MICGQFKVDIEQSRKTKVNTLTLALILKLFKDGEENR